MVKSRILPLIVICFIILGGIAFAACSSLVTGSQQPGLESEINTAVAATLVQYIIETKVAEQSVAVVSNPIQQQPQDTSTPVPTETPVPTATPLPPTVTTAPVAPAVASPVTSLPKISAEQNTNCRLGPSTAYRIDGSFKLGSVSYIHGKDSSKFWWYIEHPNKSDAYCWVWYGSTNVEGDTSSVPVVAAPANTKTSNIFGDYSVYDPYDGYYDPYGYGVYNPYGFPFNPYYCGKFVNGVLYPKCKPVEYTCKKVNWIYCGNAVINCKCTVKFKNPCKKNGCPPITQVNFKNYCKNYSGCCK
jgi:hypothetical protein